MTLSGKKLILVCLVILLAVSLMAGCASNTSSKPEEKKVYTLTAYNPMPPSSIPTQALLKMAEIAEKKSNGQLKFNVKHSGQLGSDREAIESTKMGTIDVVMSGTGMYSSFYDKVKIFDLPFLFTDENQARKVVNGAVGEEIFKDLNKQGLVYLATGNNGMRQVSSKKKIQTVEDVKGLKIRLPEMPTYLAVWKSWRSIPTPIPVSELYMSLKTGVVEAQDNAPYHTVATKCYEVQPHYTMINYMWMGLTASVNEKKFSSLPKDLQKVLKEAAVEACNWSFDAIDKANEDAFKTMKAAGVAVNMAPDRQSFQKNLPQIYEQFSKEPWYKAKTIEAIKNTK